MCFPLAASPLARKVATLMLEKQGEIKSGTVAAFLVYFKHLVKVLGNGTLLYLCVTHFLTPIL